jgi:hypothetical protein
MGESGTFLKDRPWSPGPPKSLGLGCAIRSQLCGVHAGIFASISTGSRTGLFETKQEVCIPAEAINLGDDELGAEKPASFESITQDGPVRLLPALDLDELFDDLTVAAACAALRVPSRYGRPVLTRKYDTHLPSVMTPPHNVSGVNASAGSQERRPISRAFGCFPDRHVA